MKILESYKNIAKSLLIEEEDVMGHIIKYKDEDGDEKEITVKSALQSGDSHPAYQQARDIADKGQAGLAKKDKEKPKGKALGKGDFERDLDDEKPDDEPDDPTRGDPDDAWDDEEGRAKPFGGDTGTDADFGDNIEDHEIEALISPLEVDDFIEKYDDKLSDEQKDELYDLGSDLEAAEGEMATGQIDDDEYEDKISDIQGQIANVVRGDGFEDDDSQGIDMTVKDKKAEAQMDAGRVADKVADKYGLDIETSGGDTNTVYGISGDNIGKFPGDNEIMVSVDETDDGIEYTLGMGGIDGVRKWFDSKEELESALDKVAGDKKVQHELNNGDIANITDHIKKLVGDSGPEESIKVINGKKYKPVKEEKKVTEKHPFRKTYERMGGK